MRGSWRGFLEKSVEVAIRTPAEGSGKGKMLD